MADDLGKTDGQNRQRINPTEGVGVRHWLQEFGGDAKELGKAVDAGGKEARKLGEYQTSHGKQGGPCRS